jgi:hypothetical protein
MADFLSRLIVENRPEHSKYARQGQPLTDKASPSCQRGCPSLKETKNNLPSLGENPIMVSRFVPCSHRITDLSDGRCNRRLILRHGGLPSSSAPGPPANGQSSLNRLTRDGQPVPRAWIPRVRPDLARGSNSSHGPYENIAEAQKQASCGHVSRRTGKLRWGFLRGQGGTVGEKKAGPSSPFPRNQPSRKNPGGSWFNLHCLNKRT